MDKEGSGIPVISITTSEDTNEAQTFHDPYKGSLEPLTDIEDIDHDLEQILKGSLQLVNDDDGGITDAELVDASDDERDLGYIPKIDVDLDDIIDYAGTYEELVRVGSPNKQKSKIDSSLVTASSKRLHSFLDLRYEKDGVTDNEDFDLSDEEDNAEEEYQEIHENVDILHGLMDEGERVDITDKINKTPVPSPSVTPDPGDRRNQKKGKLKKTSNERKLKINYNLSPRSLSPHLSDITDTEIVYSDSEEDQFTKKRPLSPKERRKRMKKLKESEPSKGKQNVIRSKTAYTGLPELEISSVHISEKVPVKELVSESDNDGLESGSRQHVLYAPKNKTLLMEVAGALMKDTFASTDIEHFEGLDSDDDETSQKSEYNYNVVDDHYGSVREKEVAKDALHLPKQDKVILTDTEEIDSDGESSHVQLENKPFRQIISHEGSTEEDDLEVTDTEYLAAAKELRARSWKEENYEIRFIEVDGYQRPLAITPDLPRGSGSTLAPTPQVAIYTTDTEDLDGDIDISMSRGLLGIRYPDKDEGLTDTEVFEGEDEMPRPKSPEPSDDEISQALPEPTREMILMKEDPCGRPVSVVLPLGNVEPGGLKPPRVELEGSLSEIEDMVTDDDDICTDHNIKPCSTPEIPDIDGGIIHTSEVIKVQKSKLKVMGEGPEPLTDTEYVFLSVSGKRKKSKTKLKPGLDSKPEFIKKELTDTEDLVLSDNDKRNSYYLKVPHIEAAPTTDIDDVDFSADEDDISDTLRYHTVTPEHLRELGSTVTTLKEGSGPFTEEAQQSFLSLSTIPTINTISPTPDLQFGMNTDTEDMFTSADEDGFSRAETVTPLDTGLELEDHSSVVYMKHTRKFDLEAPEEAIHVKGGIDAQENSTDVEDLGVSEDERPKPPEQLFVNDTVNEVCVCLASEIQQDESVCVCVSKEHGGLSLVWNSKNSTDAKPHRDWAEKGTPDSTLDPSSKEGEEALLDLAAGLKETKGSGTGSGPSGGK